MAKITKTNSPAEIQEIREDLNSLKHNVVALSKTLKSDTSVQLQQVKKDLSKRFAKWQVTGKTQIKRLEGQVREKPAQALGIAFVAGLAASLLLRRR